MLLPAASLFLVALVTFSRCLSSDSPSLGEMNDALDKLLLGDPNVVDVSNTAEKLALAIVIRYGLPPGLFNSWNTYKLLVNQPRKVYCVGFAVNSPKANGQTDKAHYTMRQDFQANPSQPNSFNYTATMLDSTGQPVQKREFTVMSNLNFGGLFWLYNVNEVKDNVRKANPPHKEMLALSTVGGRDARDPAAGALVIQIKLLPPTTDANKLPVSDMSKQGTDQNYIMACVMGLEETGINSHKSVWKAINEFVQIVGESRRAAGLEPVMFRWQEFADMPPSDG